MLKSIAVAVILLLNATCMPAQLVETHNSYVGTFSLGTRNTLSLFNHDEAIGKGIGGQFRLQPFERMNTEWFFDYITSQEDNDVAKYDYHIGWSVMLYPKNNFAFNHRLQPYLIAGHCFDFTKVFEKENSSNAARRTSMATQAGVGAHINISPKLDCSVSGQYMLHFGKEIEHVAVNDKIYFEKKNYSSADGHLLFTISLNYKFFRIW